jgi:hypothetical protein
MLKNKANSEPKKENVVLNMVLAVTTQSQVFEANTFKEKETKRNKTIKTGKRKNNFKII